MDLLARACPRRKYEGVKRGRKHNSVPHLGLCGPPKQTFGLPLRGDQKDGLAAVLLAGKSAKMAMISFNLTVCEWGGRDDEIEGL